ncbi:MAG: hypothetical protein ACKVQS_00795 [Fimbriimonadaceae bacterium]
MLLSRPMIEPVTFGEFGECVRCSNENVEVVCTVEMGSRIISYKKLDGENVLGTCLDNVIASEIGEYHILGGHRLWIAPENWPVTYAPEDEAATWIVHSETSLELVQPVEKHSKTQKRILISLGEGSEVRLEHSVTNVGADVVTLAPWALTIMRSGGTVWIPNETFGAHGPENLLPNRQWITWPYTDLSDPRYEFKSDSLAVHINDNLAGPQKIGLKNGLGWCEYRLPDVTFHKSYSAVLGEYPDMGSNTEIFSAAGFVEIETLGRLETLAPGEVAHHVEVWGLN